MSWARRLENKNSILLTSASDEIAVSGLPRVTALARATYEDSADDAHPVPRHRFAGFIYLLLDTEFFVRQMVMDIRSGKTGYAWVIDNQGNFLYHPVPEFIGQNAFEVREQRGAKISFAQINQIQKEKMLRGEQGTSFYVSGWHRGVTGDIKKLIAFAPIRLHLPPNSLNWSVAVAAPITEVDEVIHAAYTRQFIMQGFILVAILLGSLFVLGSEKRYTRTLETEIKHKTKDLQESEERYKKLVESAEDLIYSLDREGRFLSLNYYGAAFLHETGDKAGSEVDWVKQGQANGPKTFLGQKIFQVFGISEDFNPLVIEEVWQRGKPKVIEHVVRIADNEHWLHTQLIAIKNDQGLVQAVLGISRNVTEKKKIEKQMMNTEKLASLGLLAAGVAHEINNPLGIILGYCEYLIEKTPPEEKAYKILEKIERQGNQCKRIVENLLSFSRYSEHYDDISDVNAHLENILDVVQNNLMIKKVQVNLSLGKELPRIKADPIQLKQVFMNLISNAMGAMPEGGALTLSTGWEADTDRVKIVIADTGTGIRKENRERIFDPFFTTKQVGEGTGLGLTVTYNLVTHYGGTIRMETKTVEEDPVHHGTAFTVTFPVYHPRRGINSKGDGDV
jgi:signal transduction histidine kinase